MVQHPVRNDHVEMLVRIRQVGDVADSKVYREPFAFGPILRPLDRGRGNIDAAGLHAFACEIDRVTPVATTEIENAFHFAFDLDLIVSKSLLNESSTKADDVLIWIPVGHEIAAVNGIPVFVWRAHLVSSSGPYSVVWHRAVFVRADPRLAVLSVHRRRDWRSYQLV